MNSDPSSEDRQINPKAAVERICEGEFFIRDLLVRPWAGPDWSHPLYIECEYCRREIKVLLKAPVNVPQFVKNEAKRLTLLEHLRTEHRPKPKAKKVDETLIPPP
jgi:hypothetical protein